MCIDTRDYLYLASGATIQELEGFHVLNGELRKAERLRALAKGFCSRDPFFFEHDDDRFFGEVLLLKLSFLKKVLGHLRCRENLLLGTEFSSTFDFVRISVGDSLSLLPTLWDFKLKEIDTGCESGFPSGTVPSMERSFRLVLAWFTSFLVNKEQPVSEVDRALRNAWEKGDSGSGMTFKDFSENISTVTLLPENNYWDPIGSTVSPIWNPLWKKTLLSGWFLLKENVDSRDDQARENFFRRLDSLAGEIKSVLFRGRQTGVKGTSDADRAAILRILVRIGGNREKGTEEGERRPGKETEDLLETVILQPGGEKPLEPPSPRRKEQDLTSETVLISSKEPSKDSRIPPSRTQPKEPEMLETVILGNDPRQRESGKKEDGAKKAPDGFLAETVILKSPSEKDKDGGRK